MPAPTGDVDSLQKIQKCYPSMVLIWFRVVLRLTRTIDSVVTGRVPVALAWKNTSGEKTNKPKVVHVYTWYITVAEASRSASAKKR